MRGLTLFALWSIATLAGCSQVAQRVVVDAGTAQAMAANPAIQKFSPNAAARADCYTGIGIIASGVGSEPGLAKGGLPVPILPNVEASIEAQDLVSSHQCDSVAAAFLVFGLRQLPVPVKP